MKTIISIALLFISISLNAQHLDTTSLNTLFDKIAEKGEGSGSIAIMVDGKTVYQRAYGYAQHESAKKANSETLFRIGSITKTYTATLIMMAVEEGKLSLNTKLSDFYPAFEKSDSITIEHLLQHRSGLYNFTNSPAYTVYMTQEQTKEALIKILLEGENQFSPGSQHQYSNTGYVLLSFILEDIYKMSFQQLMQRKVVKPLGLKATYFRKGIEASENEAYSYAKTTAWEKVPETHMSVPQGAGAITATASDVNKFFNALFNNQLVSKESLAKMISMIDNYGYGLFTMPYKNKVFVGHTGGIDGFQSVSCYQEEDKLQITLLCNAVSYARNEILLAVLKIYYQDGFEFPTFEPTIILTAEDLDGYAGVYKSETFPLDITVVTKGNEITAQATGQSAFPLSPLSKQLFEFKPAGIRITFNREEKSLTLVQAGRTFTLSKD